MIYVNDCCTESLCSQLHQRSTMFVAYLTSLVITLLQPVGNVISLAAS